MRRFQLVEGSQLCVVQLLTYTAFWCFCFFAKITKTFKHLLANYFVCFSSLSPISIGNKVKPFLKPVCNPQPELQRVWFFLITLYSLVRNKNTVLYLNQEPAYVKVSTNRNCIVLLPSCRVSSSTGFYIFFCQSRTFHEKLSFLL